MKKLKMNELDTSKLGGFMFTLLLSFALSGCDSAASSSSDTPTAEDPAPETPVPDPDPTPDPDPDPDPTPDPDPDPTPDPTPDPDPDPTPDPDPDPARTLFVDFDIPVTEDGYLSVCTDYTGSGNDYEIDLESCPVRSPATAGVYQGSISLTNEVTSLIGALYFYDESATPLFQEFDIEAGQSVITWN